MLIAVGGELLLLAGFFLGENWRLAQLALETATPWIVAGVAVAAAIGGLVWWRRRRKKPAPEEKRKVADPPPPPPPAGA